MRLNLVTRLIIILIILALALWIDLSDRLTITNPINGEVIFDRNVSTQLGLDLRGGLQVSLEAVLPEGEVPDRESMEVARTILENRTNALGVSENVLQLAGDNRIVGEFPGLEDPEAVIEVIKQTGLLEFVDTQGEYFQPGAIIRTDFGIQASSQSGGDLEASTTPEPSEAGGQDPSTTPEPSQEEAETPADTEPIIYHTVMTGTDLESVGVTRNELGQYLIQFSLTTDGTLIFAQHTAANIGQFLAIVLDKQVISCPRINDAIPDGEGVISGDFTYETANALAIQLRYGSLPIPLEIVESRIVGPTLGEDSLQKSLIAGISGMIIVMLFMGLYYRLPGLVANIAILFYASIAFALFKFIPITLTLPGIAGFLLSTGAALDANILIFERMKEELRNGRALSLAIEQGWTRAWSSIRDSNIATLITSAILFWFGSSFGATIVKGFSLTLALGVAISLFTAIFVTRTFLNLILNAVKPKDLVRWFGI